MCCAVIIYAQKQPFFSNVRKRKRKRESTEQETRKQESKKTRNQIKTFKLPTSIFLYAWKHTCVLCFKKKKHNYYYCRSPQTVVSLSFFAPALLHRRFRSSSTTKILVDCEQSAVSTWCDLAADPFMYLGGAVKQRFPKVLGCCCNYGVRTERKRTISLSG